MNNAECFLYFTNQQSVCQYLHKYAIAVIIIIYIEIVSSLININYFHVGEGDIDEMGRNNWSKRLC